MDVLGYWVVFDEDIVVIVGEMCCYWFGFIVKVLERGKVLGDFCFLFNLEVVVYMIVGVFVVF